MSAGNSVELELVRSIRLAKEKDLPAIVAIYNEAIPARFATGDLTLVSVEDRLPWFQEHAPERYPIFLMEEEGRVLGWCALSAYRAGREAFRHTAELSYYVAKDAQRQGVGRELTKHALKVCADLDIKNVLAIVLARNGASQALLEQFGFSRWGYLPQVADFDGVECGHVYYGIRV